MVNLQPGFYFCHAFDLGTRLTRFSEWSKRDTLPVAPKVLRYKQVKFNGAELFVNQMGFAIVFQRINHVTNYAEAHQCYSHNFEKPYSELSTALHKLFGIRPIGDTSFVVVLGAEKLTIEWQAVHAPCTSASITSLIEALFIDELCRVVERQSDSFLKESSLAEDRLLAEYAESLFPLAYPSGFLVEHVEISEMEKYYDTWKLAGRVISLHQRFTESVVNTALYNGHLERNRQNTLNTVLAAIALLSLAQVSPTISNILSKAAIATTEEQLNQFLISAAVVSLLYGGWQYIVKPWTSIIVDNIKRAYLTRRATSGRITPFQKYGHA